MCMEPLGYGSISSTYFLGASGRASARKRPAFSQRSCQEGSKDFGSYRSLSFMVGARLEPGRTSYPPRGSDATFHLFDREPGPMAPPVVTIRDIAAHENQEVELPVKDLEVVSEAKDYPITPKEHGVAYLMEHRHLWLRSGRQNVILRVRATVVKAIRDYFDGNGFTLVDAPIFTPAACEGTSTLFTVPYFDLGNAYLTQSGQLYMEAAAAALGKVYCFGPTFRAEKSKTRRHLTEFWMVEPEVAYMTLEEDMDLAEDLTCFIVERVLDKHDKEIESVLERSTAPLQNVKKPFPRITYEEAIERLKAAGHPAKFGDDFGGDEETVLG